MKDNLFLPETIKNQKHFGGETFLSNNLILTLFVSININKEYKIFFNYNYIQLYLYVEKQRQS